jgi:hypothetical protein
MWEGYTQGETVVLAVAAEGMVLVAVVLETLHRLAHPKEITVALAEEAEVLMVALAAVAGLLQRAEMAQPGQLEREEMEPHLLLQVHQ